MNPGPVVNDYKGIEEEGKDFLPTCLFCHFSGGSST